MRTPSTVQRRSTGIDRDSDALPPAPAVVHAAPGDRFGRFVVRDVLGEGGMGVVYAAYDPELDRRIALKQVRIAGDLATVRVRRERLENEAQALARLSHPNVVTVYDVVSEGGELFIAMELVDGESLRRWAVRRERSWRAIVDVLREAGRGLEAAHAAGLVHGDVKPDNVLVDEHGRAVVVDFGLARALAPMVEEQTAGARASGGSGTITSRTGVLMGTPAYLAPEVYDGQATDALTDQFALCVTAYELLHRGRPFRGRTLAMLQTEIAHGHIDPSTRSPSVPAWLDRVVRRGLAVDRSQRFGSVRELVDALGRDPMRRARLPLAVLGLAAVPSAVALGLGNDEESRCAAGPSLVREAWSPDDRVRTRAAIEATSLSFASATADRVIDRLDARATAWADEYRRVCEATHVSGDQPPELLDARMHCLDARRSALAELRTAFANADAETVVHADEAIAALHVADDCWDVTGRSDRVLDEEDAARSRRAAELVTKARTEHELHRFDAALASSRAALDQLEGVDDPRGRAQAALANGRTLAELVSVAEARAALELARDEAEAAGDDETKLAALVQLLALEGTVALDADAARRAGSDAEATLRRLGDPPRWRADYLRTDAERLQEEGHFDEALRELELAVAARAETNALGTDERIAIAYVKLDLARFDEAEREANAVLQEIEATRGADHPATIPARDTLAVIYDRQQRGAEIEPLVAASSQIVRTVYGEDHPLMGDQHARLATVAYAAGDYPRAIAELQQAIEIHGRSLGEDHPRVANSVRNLGAVLVELDRLDEARVHLERALASHRAAFGDDHPLVATSLGNLAAVISRQGDFARATELLEQALAVQQRRLGPTHPDVGVTLHTLGITVDELGRVDEAMAYLQRAREIFVASFGEGHVSVETADANIANLERVLAGRE